MPKIKDISGQKFGRLTAIEKIRTTDHYQSIWLCKCECGNETEVRLDGLTTGRVRSCGCLRDEKAVEIHTKHGDTANGEVSRLYTIWRKMRHRCRNQNCKNYKYYGGRGIEVCEKWKKSYSVFKKWAMENGYHKDLEIDRIDNDGNYCPENCRWTTHLINMRNSRAVKHNK